MLYKKYHRNFVKQFKKGVKFKLSKDSDYIQTVITNPFVGYLTSRLRKPHITVRVADRISENDVLKLVYTSGRLVKYCYVV